MKRPAYASGFRTQSQQTDRTDLTVEGEIPAWLSGRLIRNGPAKFEAGDQSYNHWFDGLALLHAFEFEDGRVAYRSRFLRSDAYRGARDNGEIAQPEFATDPCMSIFGRIMSWFSPEKVDNANVNVARFGERFVAMTETPMPIEFDPETLETVGHLDFPSNFEAPVTTAHPHFDSSSGRVVNFVAEFGRRSTYRIVAIDPDTLTREVLGRVQTDLPAYMHSFGLTENFAVIAEFPLVVNPLALRFRTKPFIQNYEWKPERGTRFHVMRLSDGEVVGNYQTDARFAFHHVNAFERNDEIVVDVATYPDASIVDGLHLDRLRSPERIDLDSRLERFRLSRSTSNIETEWVSDASIELPRINYSRSSCRPYEFVWGIGASSSGSFADQIVRIEVETRRSTSWSEDHCYPGEPVFVERPEAKSEDDGILLSVVLDSRNDTSFLLVLDATSLDEIARAPVPRRIPFGFHGSYFQT